MICDDGNHTCCQLLRNLETILELDELGHLEKVAQLQWHVLVMHLPTRWLEDHQPARTW